jgi:hypothetical protein
MKRLMKTDELELDDGTPVEFAGLEEGSICVRLPAGSSHRTDSPPRTTSYTMWYYRRSGNCEGASGDTFKKLRVVGSGVDETKLDDVFL